MRGFSSTGARRSGPTLLDTALLTMLPLFLFFLALSSIVLDPASRWLRVPFLIIPFLVTFVHPLIGMGLVLVTAPWFEALTIHWGYGGQFAFEIGVIGFLAATAFRDLASKPNRGEGSVHLGELLLNPLWLTLVFAGTLSFISFAIGVGELKAFSAEPVHLAAAMRAIIKEAFYWDVFASAHRFQFVIGFAVLMGMMARMTSIIRQFQVRNSSIAVMFVGGSTLVFVMALFQQCWPDSFQWSFLTDVAGTFQNGNHLSFYSGLIVFMLAFLGARGTVPIFASVIGSGLFLLPLVWGIGRTAWIALAIASIGAGLFAGLGYLRLGKGKRAFWMLAPITFVIAGFFFTKNISWHLNCGADSSICQNSADLLEKIRHSSVSQLFRAHGRGEVNDSAQVLIAQHPLRGIGIGSFFLGSGHFMEIHNQYLYWLVAFGWLGIIFLAIGVLAFSAHLLARWLAAKSLGGVSEASVNIGFSIYLAVAFFGDSFFMFREFAFIVGCWFVALTTSPEKNRHGSPLDGIGRVATVTAIFVAIAIGVSFVWSPQSLIPVSSSSAIRSTVFHDEGVAQVGPLSSFGRAHELSCGRALVYSSTNVKSPTISVYMKPWQPNPRTPTNLSQIDLSQLGVDASVAPTQIVGGVWNPLCFCVAPDHRYKMGGICSSHSGCEFSFLAPFGSYPSWVKGYDSNPLIHPTIFHSLLVTGAEMLPEQELFTRPWKWGASCQRVVELKMARP